jgi:hypothetical protein
MKRKGVGMTKEIKKRLVDYSKQELIDYVKDVYYWYKMKNKLGKEVEGVLLLRRIGGAALGGLQVTFHAFSNLTRHGLYSITAGDRPTACQCRDSKAIAPCGTLLEAVYTRGVADHYPVGPEDSWTVQYGLKIPPYVEEIMAKERARLTVMKKQLVTNIAAYYGELIGRDKSRSDMLAALDLDDIRWGR